MAGDDAFGHLVAEALRGDPPPGAEVLDVGMNPGELLDHLEGRRALLLVDAAYVPDMEPGKIIECNWRSDGAPQLAGGGAISSHGLGIVEQLKLADRLKMLPGVVKIVALTIEPAQGPAAASEMMSAQLATAVERVREVARRVATPRE